jgi:hypothetical protein
LQYKNASIKSKTYRTISTQYPPIDLFENLCDSKDYEQAAKWEMFTNPRLIRQHLIPHEDCVFGTGASYLMAPFFYNTPPARFSTQFFGGYYAAENEVTSIYEKSYHLGEFIADTEDEAFSEGLYVLILKGQVSTSLTDLTAIAYTDAIYDKDSYNAAQTLAQKLHADNSNGIVYNSVRNLNNKCFVIYKPKQVGIPIVTKKLPLHFDGGKIDKYYEGEGWVKL